MKGILYLFLGLLLGAGSVSAQVAGGASAQVIGGTSAQVTGFSPGYSTNFSPWPDSGRNQIVGPQVSIRIMAPDRMPCLMPDLARLARMPTLCASNGDRMPNGLRLPGRGITPRPGSLLIKPEEK